VEQRYVGASGLRVSVLTLGTLQWGADTDLEESAELLDRFVDEGGTTLDVAGGIGAGAGVLGHLLAATHRREDLVLVARGGLRGEVPGGPTAHDVSRRALLADLDATLRALGTDHVDLWLADGWSDDVPVEETLSALSAALAGGRARYVGVAGHAGWQAARAATLCRDVTAAAAEWSLVARGAERELVPACAGLGLGVVAWGALGRGVLTGKYRSTVPADSRAASGHLAAFVGVHLRAGARRVVDAVVTAADGLGVAPAHVALGWLCAHPELATAVVGPRTAAQLRGIVEGPGFAVPGEIATVLDEVSARA
jgi:aryl-alcohol dehydrogenase-like predicted oxidoreductase